MKPVSSWLPELRSTVSGADDPVLLQALNATLREFFTRGGGWKQQLPDITLKDGRANYTINPQSDGIVLYPDTAEIDGSPIKVYPNKDVAPLGGTGIYMVDANTIAISPVPNDAMAGKALQISALWRLPPNCQNVPDAVFDNWFDEILHGTKSRLYMQPSKPWSSDKLGAIHLKSYNIGIGRFRAMMRKGYTTAEPAWRFPSWA